MDLYKELHVGSLIQRRAIECEVEMSRICNFLNCSESDILRMYQSKSLPTDIVLRWSKLLEYDFFRIYTQHLILYAPPAGQSKERIKSSLPKFRKNIYTKEVIEFVLELLEKEEKTKGEILQEYNIPKTTLYKWIDKYRKQARE